MAANVFGKQVLLEVTSLRLFEQTSDNSTQIAESVNVALSLETDCGDASLSSRLSKRSY